MPSGAGHDAQMLARICPAAMIFTPSVDGLSHNIAEHTHPADVTAGADVLLHTLLELGRAPSALTSLRVGDRPIEGTNGWRTGRPARQTASPGPKAIAWRSERPGRREVGGLPAATVAGGRPRAMRRGR